MQSESPSGAVNHTPTQDEPQSYPMAQIAEYQTKDPVTKGYQIPNLLSGDTQKEKENAIRPNGFPRPDTGRPR